jgi:hypothetical protein
LVNRATIGIPIPNVEPSFCSSETWTGTGVTLGEAGALLEGGVELAAVLLEAKVPWPDSFLLVEQAERPPAATATIAIRANVRRADRPNRFWNTLVTAPR